MFAIEHSSVKPDVMCLAKGIGSGLPIGICIAKDSIMNWGKGAHASIFGGNPVCIASAGRQLNCWKTVWSKMRE